MIQIKLVQVALMIMNKIMANEFEMSMIGELSYFLGLQIKQLKNGIFVSQGEYI